MHDAMSLVSLPSVSGTGVVSGSGPVHTNPDIFSKGDFSSIFEKNRVHVEHIKIVFV